MILIKTCAIIILLNVVPSVLTTDLQDENPFAFYMFENFDLSKQVFLGEIQLVEKLNQSKQELQKRSKDIKSLLEDIKTTHNNVGDPQSALKILKRSFLKVKPLRIDLKKFSKSRNESRKNVDELTKDFPSIADWDGARKALFLLHDTYEFNLTEATKANIVYKNSHNEVRHLRGREKLTAHDLAELGAFGLRINHFYGRAVQFLREALRVPDNSLEKKESDNIKAMAKIAAKLNNKALKEKKFMIGKNYKASSHFIDEKSLNEKSKKPKLENGDYGPFKMDDELSKDQLFLRVCQKGAIFNNRKSTPPKCVYYHHFDPYLKVGPFKVEILSTDPYVVIYPQFFSEDEMKWLVDYSIPRLSRTRFHDDFNEGPKYNFKNGKKVRIIHKTVQTWIEEIKFNQINKEDFTPIEINYPNLYKLAERMGLAGNVETILRHSTTAFQTTNYGLGGICETHVDPHGYLEGKEVPEPENYRMNGDIMATFMGWLSDTEAGGGTAFIVPNHELLLTPQRGSLAFWYGVDTKGERVLKTTHGGCPVLKGSKWILNKWIMYFNQFKKFPCSVNPSATFPIPTGHY